MEMSTELGIKESSSDNPFLDSLQSALEAKGECRARRGRPQALKEVQRAWGHSEFPVSGIDPFRGLVKHSAVLLGALIA